MSGKIALDVVLGFDASLDKNYDELANAGVAPWNVEQFYMFALQQQVTHYLELTPTLLNVSELALVVVVA